MGGGAEKRVPKTYLVDAYNYSFTHIYLFYNPFAHKDTSDLPTIYEQ